MRSLPVLSAVSSVKIITAGALAVAGAAGFLFNSASDANATDALSVVALPEAQYWCVSDSGCAAGGVEQVPKNGTVGPNSALKIDARERSVSINCKEVREGVGAYSYQVDVGDTNWSGTWDLYKNMIKDSGSINDNIIPVC
jgi:hypothetical protein